MTTEPSQTPKTPAPSSNKPSFNKLLTELAISIIIPTLILKKLSGDDSLGPVLALLLALSLPLGYGIYEFIQEKKVKLVPALGFINILLTGGIGLLKLPSEYIAIKEAMIPLVIGLITMISIKTKYPLIRTFLYNDMVMDTARVDAALDEQNNRPAFNKMLVNATWLLGASFLVSAVLNYALAKWVVTAPSGTPEFNSQLGTMTMLSYPVIVIPCMAITIYALYYVIKRLQKLTGLSLEDILNT